MSEHSLAILTSSQESQLLAALNLNNTDAFGDFENHFDTVEEKYNIPHTENIDDIPIQLPIAVANDDQPLATGDYVGKYNFQMLPDLKHESKTWTYSTKLKKVFTEMGSTLPICVKWTPSRSGLYIRAVMAFCSANYRSDCVSRCPNHIAGSNTPSPHLYHVLSCKQNNASYSFSNGHYTVLVPLGTPQPGTDYVQMDFAFHCKNSCSPGMNRRATEVVFNLETDTGEILGRRQVPVKICSCPKRDRMKDEAADGEFPASKKRKLSSGKKAVTVHRGPTVEADSEVFTFTTKIVGRENFETLKTVAYGLLAGTLARGGQSAVIQPIMDELQRSS